MKKKTIVGILAAMMIGGFICFWMWLFSGAGGTYYYTQIDNSKVEQGKPRDGVIDWQGGMAYSYTLPAYDEKGGGSDVTFGASRELREDAFICLTVMPVRGVVEWSEVQYEELPEAVQSHYTVSTE